jgi:CRP-like cAMP-binding protein
MPTDRLVAPLLRVPIFAGLQPLQITEIARQAERVRFRRGALLTRAGEPGEAAYLIVSGKADRVVRSGFAGATEPIEPGSLIGEMAMLVEHEYRSTIIARDRVLCLKIMRAAIHVQMLDDIALARHFERQLRSRLGQVAWELRQIDSLLAACGAGETQLDSEEASTATAGSS